MQSRLARQLAEAAAALHDIEAPFALIGGLALASHGVVRGTIDIDFFDATAGDGVDALLKGLGYQARHRSEDAATYVRRDERIDLPYARRPVALKLLADARELAGALRPSASRRDRLTRRSPRVVRLRAHAGGPKTPIVRWTS